MTKVTIRQRGKTFSYKFDTTTLDGRRKRVEKGGFATKKEAYDAGVKALASYNSGNIAITSEKISVKDFLAAWLKRKEQEIRPTTAKRYNTQLQDAICIIGDIALQKLRPRDVDNMIRQIAAKGKARGTINGELNRLREAFDFAVYPAELLQTNPARYVKIPANLPQNVVKREVIAPDKLQKLLNDAPFNTPYHIPILLAYHTGMRLGEVQGLCWENVDLKKQRITVTRQLCYVTAKGYYFDEPKTPTSRRSILIDGELTATLKKWKAQQAKNEIAAGKKYTYAYTDENGSLWQTAKMHTVPDGYIRRALVCTTEAGAIVPKSSITQFMCKHGTNFHSLRHTHATLLIENNAIAKDVAARLGHADATITQNLYTHDTKEMQENTLTIFERTLQKMKNGDK